MNLTPVGDGRTMKKYFSMSSCIDDHGRGDDAKMLPYWKHVFEHFAALEGMDLEYFGCDSAAYEFKLDDIIFKVLEDPDDGYRSCLGVIEYGDQSDAIFFRHSLGKVRIETYSDETEEAGWRDSIKREGYRLVDVSDGHVWLEFGTDNTDDYYPYFVFRHTPKQQETGV